MKITSWFPRSRNPEHSALFLQCKWILVLGDILFYLERMLFSQVQSWFVPGYQEMSPSLSLRISVSSMVSSFKCFLCCCWEKQAGLVSSVYQQVSTESLLFAGAELGVGEWPAEWDSVSRVTVEQSLSFYITQKRGWWAQFTCGLPDRSPL